jgi:hypothetical protein
MMKIQKVPVDDIYVPAARRKTLHPETVRHLVEGLHRLEAAKWLGEAAIDAYLVQARKH